jgi:hypothetical protein
MINLVRSHVIIGLVVIFIAVFALFYIFDSLNKLAERCRAGESLPICQQLTGFTLSMIIILLLIGGFVIVILAVVYIMLSA